MKKSSHSRKKRSANVVPLIITGSAPNYNVSSNPIILKRANRDSVLWVNATADGTDVIVCMVEDAAAADRAFFSTQFYVPYPTSVPSGPVRTSAKTDDHLYFVFRAADDCPFVALNRRKKIGPKTITVQ